jgi:hypothetical protein
MKKFVDERKRLANKHEQETIILSKLVKEEEDALSEENKKVLFPYKSFIQYILFYLYLNLACLNVVT